MQFFVIVSIIFGSILAHEEILAGKVQLKCGPNGQILKQETDTTIMRLPPLCNALYSVNTRRNRFCQNCPFMTWKMVRTLELYLNYNFPKTPTNGLIEIKNNLIIRGYDYLLHVILVCHSAIEERDLVLKISEGEEEEKVIGDLELEGGVVKSGLPVIVNGRVEVCGDVEFYWFKWSILQNGTNLVLPERSRKLVLPPSYFVTFKESFLTITCQVKDGNSNKTLLEKTINNTISAQPQPGYYLKVFMPYKRTTLSSGSALTIEPFIDTNVDYHVQWTCIFEDFLLGDCRRQQSPKLYLERGFTYSGNYSIGLTIWSDTINQTHQCIVGILNGTPSIEIAVKYPVRPEDGWQVSATISQLRTYCVVEWRSPWLQYVPNIGPTIFNISSKDASFMPDMMDFGGIPTTRTYLLTIPAPTKTWRLQPNNYTVNVHVSCPVEDIEVEEEVRSWVVAEAEVEVSIEMTPHVDFEVTALEQGFIYKVTGGDDGWYKFGYTWKVAVVFHECVGCTTAETMFPLSGGTPIETWIEICRSDASCGKSFGPDVAAEPNYANATQIMPKLRQLMFEENYFEALALAFVVVHSVPEMGALVSEVIAEVADTDVGDAIDLVGQHRSKRSAGEMDETVKCIEVLALLDSPNTAEKDHMIQRIDQWMQHGCALRNHQHTSKIELPNLAVYLQPLASGFDHWNQTIQVNVTNSTRDECVGISLYNGIVNGVGVYEGNGGVVVTIPRPQEPVECVLYQRGRDLCTTLIKETSVECQCEEMGFVFLQPKKNLDGAIRINSRTRQIFYFVIVSSLMGFAILCYIIRKLSIYPQHNIIFDGFNDDAHHAHVMYDDVSD